MLGRTDHDVQVPLPQLPAIDRRRIRAGSTGANLSVSLDEGAAALPFHTERSRRQTQTGLLSVIQHRNWIHVGSKEQGPG